MTHKTMADRPITPPPELVEQLICENTWDTGYVSHSGVKEIAAQLARWGADQELEACCEWFQELYKSGDVLRAARRPEPPSLKEQALEALDRMDQLPTAEDRHTIRRALDQLDD